MAEGGQVNVDDGKSTDVTEERQVRSGELKLNLADDFQADVQAEVPSDSTSQFDDATLKAIAEVYLKDGDNEYSKGEAYNAVHLYTEGLQVNCKDIQVNAALYSNRAAAQLLLGNYQEALDDATVSVQFEPTFIKAIENGASACEQLHFYQEAIGWCQKGLAMDHNNKKLLDLWTQCVTESTDGTDESGSRQEVKTNCDKNSAESEDIKINKQLYQTAMKKVLLHENNSHLSIKVGEKAGERNSYGNLGNAYQSLGDFQRAIQYHESHLKIAKEVGDKAGEGNSYGNLGNAYHSLGDFQRAIQYHEHHLKIAIEVGDKAGEGKSYGNLGNAYNRLGDFQRAIQYHERHLKIAKEVGDKAGEENSYGNLGNAYHSLGDFQRAIQYHERHLKIAKEVGDKTGEGNSYGSLGNAYRRLGDFQRAIQYYERHLKIAKEVGDKAGEGKTYGNLGNAYHSLGDFQRAIQYHEHDLKIAIEVGDKAGEGAGYGNLGNAYNRLGDFQRAIQYSERHLKIAKEVGDKNGEGRSYCNLGRALWSLGDLERAANFYHSSVLTFEAIRTSLWLNDDWKISYRDMQKTAYNCLWRLRLKQNQIFDALLSAEQGRAQALNDLIRFRYGLGETQPQPHTPRISDLEVLIGDAVSNTVFMAVDSKECKIFYWFINSLQDIQLRSIEMSSYGSFKDVNNLIESLINTASREFNRGVIKCENRSLDEPYDEELVKKRSGHAGYSLECSPNAALRKLYDVIIEPVADLVNCNELTIVPESSLWLVPFAALMDSESNYLCDSFRVRMIPSLTTLKLINNYQDDFHNKKGALLVGDPCLEEVLFQERKLDPLPCAREEVTMIGRILGTDPLIGEEAKKDEVLRRLPFVALVHFAAHGRMETGEIALAPSRACSSQPFGEEEFLLTMKDVLNIQIRAKLVVLSCCHSARGEIKAEGVVGIARAFLGAGARSVLVSLWAIDDGATLEFMKHFYEELVTGKLASEALNQAMRSMKKSEKLSDVKYWAPFVLIGDDVSLEFN